MVYIDTEIMGRRIATRSLALPPRDSKQGQTLTEVVDRCIANHLALYQAPGTPAPGTPSSAAPGN